MNIFRKNYNKYYKSIDNLLEIFKNSIRYFYTNKNSLVITDDTFKDILEDLRNIYKNILNSSENKLRYKETKKIKDDANSNFYILFNQDQYIETIKILKTIFDIYQYLCDNNDKDLKEKIHYTIYDLLLFSSSKEDNQAEVNYILDRLFLCMLSDKNTLTIYYNFYTIVFDRFRQEKFNNIYLTSFNKYALNILKHLLDIDNMKTFKCVVDISINKSMDIYDSYGENIDKLKINKFRELFLKTTSFALYKKNYEALDILFNFHTPKDYTVLWCNEDILPHSLDEVFEWVYNNNIWVEELEDHHGIASYYEKLTYLLILRALYKNNNISKDINLRDLENINFSDLHRIQKFNLKALKDFHPNTKYNEKDLEQSEKEVLSVVNDIFNNNKLLDIIGINEDNIDKIKNEFIDALKIISKLANEMEINIIKKSQCSNEKINNVKNKIFENYQKNNNLLSIFNQYNLTSNDYYNNFETSYIGYNVALSKEIFIDDYGVSFVGMEADFAEGIYRRENLIILDKVRKKVQQKYIEDLEDLITKSENKEDLFIILNYADLFNLRSLQKTMNITLKDKYLFSKEEKNTFKEFNLNNFVGILMCNNISIPVYSCFMGDNKSQLFLLSKNREKFGSVIEYIYNGEEKEYFDEQTKLFCKLSEFEDKKRVWLQLYKKIDINLANNFEGYMISLNGY